MTSALSMAHYEKRVYPFPADPLERVGNILAAYNASSKALAHLLVTRAPATRLELSKRFEVIVAGTALEETDSYNVNRYCRHSLCPLGLVVHEQLPASGRYGYQITYALTDAGRKYGQPAAAAFLEFERKYGFSLFPIFGSTHSTMVDGPKPPLTRALILCELMSGSKRAIDLTKRLNRSELAIGRSLHLLARSGAISYETLNQKTQETQVTLTLGKRAPDRVVPVGGYSRLTPLIVDICLSLEKRRVPITHSAVRTMVRKKHQSRGTDTSLSSSIATVLSGLIQQGYLKRKKFSQHTKSMATITPKGRCVVTELIQPLMKAMQERGQLLSWQRDLLPKVLTHLSEYAEQTGNLYYPLSKSRDKLARQERLELLLKLLQTGNGKTVNQLARTLRISKVTVSQYLSQLATAMPMRKRTQKTVVYYSLRKLEALMLPRRSL